MELLFIQDQQMSEENSTSFIPTSPEDIKQISGVIKDISDMMAMKAGHTSAITAHKKALREDWGYTDKQVTMLINWYHKQEAEAAHEIFEETQNIYDALFPQKS